MTKIDQLIKKSEQDQKELVEQLDTRLKNNEKILRCRVDDTIEKENGSLDIILMFTDHNDLPDLYHTLRDYCDKQMKIDGWCIFRFNHWDDVMHVIIKLVNNEVTTDLTKYVLDGLYGDVHD